MSLIDNLNFNNNIIRTISSTFTNKPVTVAYVLKRDTEQDTVSFGQDKTEKFEEVFAEFRKNVPDSTSTISEKELALFYIDKMLACSDISDDLKVYWQNKKSIIQQEIQTIKNENKIGNNEKISDVWGEFEKFCNKYQDKFNTELSVEDRSEYLMTYNRTCLSFLKRLLACSDITDELKSEYIRMYQNHVEDLNNAKRDLQNAKNSG